MVLDFDKVALRWRDEAELRLRRELCWRRSEHYRQEPNTEQKSKFFSEDETARYFTDKLLKLDGVSDADIEGTLSWLVDAWALEAVECWLIGLALYAFMEGQTGVLFAEALGRSHVSHPNLRLAQLLWDQPLDLLIFLDRSQRLRVSGILQIEGVGWDAVVSIHPAIARSLLKMQPEVPLAVRLMPTTSQYARDNRSAHSIWSRLERSWDSGECPWIHVRSFRDERLFDFSQKITQELEKPLFHFIGAPEEFGSMMTWAWLQGVALVVRERPNVPLPLVPVMIFDSGGNVEDEWTYAVERSSYQDRLQWFRAELKNLTKENHTVFSEIDDCALRFRLGPVAIQKVCHIYRDLWREGSEAPSLRAICQTEVRSHFGALAKTLSPRIHKNPLVLSGKVALQFDEVCCAIRGSLADVNNPDLGGGLTVLLSGPPGTGKTMAVETLSERTELPVYKIDSSQVVSKYIGETEKNLEVVFGAAEEADCILFFDEADSLFGKRTEIRDAHDRYANFEVNYLLQRIESFRGVVVLATNRRRDLDEAFLRRIRYVVEFPLPEVKERRKIWNEMLETVDFAEDIDTGFLAKQFAISGGHIKSVVQNATAIARLSDGKQKNFDTVDVLVSVYRELEKLGRPITADQFGSFKNLVLERLQQQENL